MKSMTGYACREIAGEDMTLSLEIRGYNSRFLELSVSLPPWLSSLEPRIRDFISSRNKRGKIEISVRLRDHKEKISVSVNTQAALAYQKAVSLLAESLGTGEKPGLSLILGMEGVLEVEKNRDDDRYWKQIEPLLFKAAEDFEAERLREGRHTEADVLSHIAAIESAVTALAAQAPALETSIRENLRSRFAELLGNQVDENRVLAETAVLLVKYSISEEISRLSSHLAEFRAETRRNPSPGKKLDFLCQEINREINTIGSKTTVLEVSRAVVDMKDALENVREQLRNVE
jgi:uncharacterized protein (TIGR00255 family)